MFLAILALNLTAVVVCQLTTRVFYEGTPQHQTAYGFLMFAIWLILMVFTDSYRPYKESK